MFFSIAWATVPLELNAVFRRSPRSRTELPACMGCALDELRDVKELRFINEGGSHAALFSEVKVGISETATFP